MLNRTDEHRLAAETGLNIGTIKRWQAGDPVRLASILALEGAAKRLAIDLDQIPTRRTSTGVSAERVSAGCEYRTAG